jgi:catechol 2,3-dioxygenase-like lactoylglutathione lyase family enzyme
VKTFLYHLQINVGDGATAIPFYRALFGYLEYRTVVETHDMIGVSNGTTDFWMIATPNERRSPGFHRKNTGVNHLCFGVRERGDVDRFAADFMKPRGIAALYDSPREYPEYRPDYYAVFFEDPDRLKIEIAHVPGITDIQERRPV